MNKKKKKNTYVHWKYEISNKDRNLERKKNKRNWKIKKRRRISGMMEEIYRKRNKLMIELIKVKIN